MDASKYTKDELYKMATAKNIKGRSTMNKMELALALGKAAASTKAKTKPVVNQQTKPQHKSKPSEKSKSQRGSGACLSRSTAPTPTSRLPPNSGPMPRYTANVVPKSRGETHSWDPCLNNNSYDLEEQDVEQLYYDFCEQNIQKKPDYVFVCTGYTHRVLPNFRKDTQDDIVAVLPDIAWEPNMKPWSQDDKVLDICNKLPKQYVETGGIVYKCTADIGFEIEYVSKTCNRNFCASCSVTNTTAKWFNIQGKGVIVFLVDTESG
jgi:hypothetical protein